MHDCLMKNTATIKQLSESKDPGIITCEESTEKKSKEKGVQNGKIRKGGGGPTVDPLESCRAL